MARTNSPLRYPGGKSCLYWLMADVLRMNNLECGHYAEPYAGGGGLALSLLYGGHVGDIHLNDIDKSIWSFWFSVLHDTDRFVDRILNTPVTIEEWHRQREVFQNKESFNTIEVAFSTFYLNRTNRSGVIKGGGVIGGVAQTGPYKIDCRYNVADLVGRIRRIKKYSDRIHLSNLDAIEFMSMLDSKMPRKSLWFVDPPYFNKGSELYTSFYRKEDHEKVATAISKLSCPSVVTYDDSEEIRHLYLGKDQYLFDISYSLANKKVGTELFIASEGLRVPENIQARKLDYTQQKVATALQVA